MPPKLTVVVTAGERRERVVRNLACLLVQTALQQMEILVIDLRPDLGALSGAEHPAVRVILKPKLRSLWSASAVGAREARGEIVAFIEDHCFAEPAWAAALINAYRRPVAAVNYAFKDADPQTYVSRAFLMTEYGRWMVPAKAGPVTIPSCSNISYRRERLLQYADRLEECFKVEYMLHREIRAAGGTIWLEPKAIVAHEDWLRFSPGLLANGSLKRVHAATLAFGREPWSWARRVFYAAAMVVAPPLHLWRLGRSLVPRPALWLAFVKALPVSMSVYCYMSFCEALGYLFGPGSAESDFNAVELSITRKSL